jgi:hypothetical protein
VVEDFNPVQAELAQLGQGEIHQPQVDLDTVVHAVVAEDLSREGRQVCTGAENREREKRWVTKRGAEGPGRAPPASD